jgi:hypothetical protein
MNSRNSAGRKRRGLMGWAECTPAHRQLRMAGCGSRIDCGLRIADYALMANGRWHMVAAATMHPSPSAMSNQPWRDQAI